MLSVPRVDERREQPYLAVRSQVPMDQLPTAIPQGIVEVHRFLEEHGIRPAGAPFVRYHQIDMPGLVDISVGWPFAGVIEGNGRVTASSLPTGRYLSAVYTGNYTGLIEATAELIKWGEENAMVWDSQPTAHGEAFGARLESYWTDPAEEPDFSKHETEIAIRLM
jgi:effector-binding domain-containing protein